MIGLLCDPWGVCLLLSEETLVEPRVQSREKGRGRKKEWKKYEDINREGETGKERKGEKERERATFSIPKP